MEDKLNDTLYKDVIGFIKIVSIAVVLSFVIRVLIFENVLVSGSSMYPTLENGSHLVLSKITSYTGNFDRGDIIVFYAPDGTRYLKRIIGISGDTVNIKEDKLYVNNVVVDEYYLDKEYMRDRILRENLKSFTNDFQLSDLKGNPKIVPEGHIFVMGDNRPVSNDSREIGFIDKDEIIGKIVFFD